MRFQELQGAWVQGAPVLPMLATPEQSLAELLLMAQPCTLSAPAVALKAAAEDCFGIPGMSQLLEYIASWGRGGIPVLLLTWCLGWVSVSPTPIALQLGSHSFLLSFCCAVL